MLQFRGGLVSGKNSVVVLVLVAPFASSLPRQKVCRRIIVEEEEAMKQGEQDERRLFLFRSEVG